jgi:two-component system nitrogen regulation sensor histidine kinase NtrY
LNKWFKKFPYPGWLFAIVVLATVTTIMYHLDERKFSNSYMAGEVQQDFQSKDDSTVQDYKSGRFDTILENVSTAVLPAEYFFYIIRDSGTYAWNTTKIDLPFEVKHEPQTFLDGRLYHLNIGFYYLKTWKLHTPDTSHAIYYALTVIPIQYSYPIENQYFQSHFSASPNIPNSTEVLDHAAPKAFAIYQTSGKPVFYLNFVQSKNEYFIAGFGTWIFAIFTCLSIVFWIHESCYGIGLRTGKPKYGFLILCLLVIPLSCLLRVCEFPAGFQNSKIFSPELYSSKQGGRYFGNLILNILCDSWGLIYLIAYVPLNEKLFVRSSFWEKLIRLLVTIGILFYLYSYFATAIIKFSIDGKIPFEAGNFSNLNVFTFVGIFTVIVVTINFLILIGVTNELLRGITKGWYWKLGLFIGISLVEVYFIYKPAYELFYWLVVLLALISLILIDRFGFPLRRGRNQYDIRIATSTYVWFAILCSWVTIEIYYFNYSKELELRKLYAHMQERKDVGYTAYKFIGYMDDLQKDSLVNDYFHDINNKEKKDAVSQYINYIYLDDYSSKFNIGIYFYDKNRKPILQSDTIDMALLRYADSLKQEPFKYGMLDVENVAGGNFIYWFLSPFENDEGTDTLGYIGFNIFADKRYRKGSSRPFFEINKNPTDEQYYNNYSYAIYHNSNLWTQNGNVLFPYTFKDNLKNDEFRFEDNNKSSSTLLYKTSQNETIKVVYTRNILTNAVSLFSYVLAIVLLLSGIIFLIRYLIFYPGRIKFIYSNFTFTIRSKVNLTILVTVFLSLFIVGFITLSFLNNRYRDGRDKSQQSLLMFYTQYIRHATEDKSFNIETIRSSKFSTFSEFSYKLKRLAEEQGAELNIYNLNGRLISTSQIDFYQKRLLSRFIDPGVLRQLRNERPNEVIRDEKLGNMEYQSLYAPVRDKYDKIIAYLNIPYYASSIELNNEVSNVLVTLINVYALVFFLSGICAIFISNSIIRSFRLLIDQFRNIRLRHNEYIKWPYRDEIALLVNEYNSMMRKVEMMATRLARTEREAAWRDIARQVAHEIKNPLTPMKLNIQYLQQAIATDRPDLDKLALKVSNVLIEQIETLNVIASEFSNFAKMPDASPEDLNIKESLQTLIELFEKTNDVHIELMPDNASLMVYMDKGYLIRVFTNLIQNALQSVEEGNNAKIIISYEQKENSVVITIEDNGTGIPKELQDKLFQPYFTTKSSGTGLGLPMTKNLVENSDGSIWFETKEGIGTKFFVKLPVGETN